MRRDDGRLLHAYRAGKARFDAYLDDYTHLANALVTLYENSFQERWIAEAIKLVEITRSQFADQHPGGFFYTAADHEPLIARSKDVQDASVPSGNGMAATVLVRLGKLLGRADYLDEAERTMKAFAELLRQSPGSTGQLLLAWDSFAGRTPELVLFGGTNIAEARQAIADIRRLYLPHKVFAFRWADATATNREESDNVMAVGVAGCEALAPVFADKQPDAVHPTLFVCENFACQAPVVGLSAIQAATTKLAR
jgi:hypothetical protein